MIRGLELSAPLSPHSHSHPTSGEDMGWGGGMTELNQQCQWFNQLCQCDATFIKNLKRCGLESFWLVNPPTCQEGSTPWPQGDRSCCALHVWLFIYVLSLSFIINQYTLSKHYLQFCEFTANHQTGGKGRENSQFIANWSKIWVTTWDLQLASEEGDSLMGLSR